MSTVFAGGAAPLGSALAVRRSVAACFLTVAWSAFVEGTLLLLETTLTMPVIPGWMSQK